MRNIQGLIVGLALWAAASACLAGGLTPEAFVQADIAAREVTLKGMSDRLALLKAGKGLKDEMAAISASEKAVAGEFAKYGTTANKHAAYAARHGAEIEAWLEAHPEWHNRLWELQIQFSNLSQEFDALRGR
jgi:hypothetical protein